MQDTDAAPLLDVISHAETLDQTVAAIPMAVVVVDLDGRVVLWSGAAEELYGWKASQAVGKLARDLMAAPETDERAAALMARLRRGARWSGTFPVRRQDGSTFEAFAINAPVHDARGTLTGIVSLSVDSEDRRVSPTEHAIAEARFRSLVETAHDGIWMIDGTGSTSFANQPMADILGADLDDLVGSSAYDWVPDPDLAEAIAIIDGLRSGVPQRFDFRLLRADGAIVQVDMGTTPIVDRRGAVLGAMATVTDVTAEREAAERLRRQQEQLEMALDAGDLAAWELDLATGTYTMADNLESVYGVRASRQPTLRDFLDRVVPEDRHLFLEMDPRADDAFCIDFRIRRDDEIAWLRTQGRVIGDESGGPVAIRGTTVDVTESVVADMKRAEAAAVHRETVRALPDAFVGTDGNGLVTDWNPAAELLFGWTAEEVMGQHLVERVFVPEDRAFYQERIEVLTGLDAEDVPSGRIELVLQHRDGHVFPVELSLAIVRVDGAPQLRAFLRDITARRAHEQDLADRALIDQLTGLPNRILLEDRLARAIARVERRNVHATVMFLDVDRLKAINESLGHAAGDAVLLATANRLRQVVGTEHTVARHGGDEFIVLCEDLPSPEVALGIARKIETAFATPMAVSGRRLTVGLSIGLASVSTGGIAPEDLIRDADIAMHQAKALGGGRIEVLEPSSARKATRRLDLEEELRRALATHQITVAYQPVVDLDGKLASLEALARWEHPQRGTITPAEFIPVAEETGLIVDLSKQVLDQAWGQLAEWRQRPGWSRLTLAANLSGRQLVEPDLVGTIERLLQVHGLPSDAVCLEITESMLMDERSVAAATVDGLADLGICLAVDDFGTGYSSLLYLRRFPVQALKLDRSFVAGIGTSDVDTTIVGSMIDLAHALHLVAVAEGVETAEQVQALRARGCDLAQGYFFSRPVPAAELTLLLDDPRFGP